MADVQVVEEAEEIEEEADTTRNETDHIITLLKNAREHIRLLEKNKVNDDMQLNAALKELKESAQREELLMRVISKKEQDIIMFSKREKLLLKHLNEYQNETSIRDLLNCQKEQTRVNLHLMRSLESICEKTQLETKHNNLLRMQMIEALERETIVPTKIENAKTTEKNDDHFDTILVHVDQNGLGCAFDQNWHITTFRTHQQRNGDGSTVTSPSAMESAGAKIGDQLIAINHLYLLIDLRTRESITQYLNDLKKNNQKIEMIVKREDGMKYTYEADAKKQNTQPRNDDDNNDVDDDDNNNDNDDDNDDDDDDNNNNNDDDNNNNNDDDNNDDDNNNDDDDKNEVREEKGLKLFVSTPTGKWR
jgi:hypothetical protein